jgi:hypothetical protein
VSPLSKNKIGEFRKMDSQTTVEAKRKTVPAEEFIRAAWESYKAGEGLKGIADRTGQKVEAISTRLSSMKKKGVKTPEFKKAGGNNKLDVDFLNNIGAEFTEA